jgi:hypothetical protein
MSPENDPGKEPCERNNPNAGGGLGGNTTDSGQAGNEPNQNVDGFSQREAEDSQAENEDQPSRTALVGGILRQLRQLQKAHLAYVEAHQERLETRLSESKAHKNQITSDMEQLEAELNELLRLENPTVENDEEE